MNRQHSALNGKPPILWRLFAQVVASVALLAMAFGLRYVSCWGLFVLIALIAWPIWVNGSEVSLFERRLFLEGLTRKDSRFRRWFWAGTMTQVFLAVVSVVLALILLVLAARLGAEEWIVLGVDVIVLSLLVEPTRSRVSRDVLDEQSGAVTRRWPLRSGNVAALTLVFAALDFWLGSVDTRALTWNQVAEQAFLEEAQRAVCAPVGWLIGLAAAFDSLSWHAAQITTPAIPDTVLRLGLWVSVLLNAGVLAYLFTRLQLGVMSLVERRTSPDASETLFTRAFVYTILLLAIPYLYANSKLAQLDATALGEKAREVVTLTDPCRLDPQIRDRLLAALNDDLKEARRIAQQDASNRIDDGAAMLVADLGPAVDAYLDWYFTVLGEYERLAALATGDLIVALTEKLEHYVFEKTEFAKKLHELELETSKASLLELQESVKGLGPSALKSVQPSACEIGQLDLADLSAERIVQGLTVNLDRDAAGVATAVGGGAAATAASMKLLAKKAGSSATTKVVATKSFQAAAGLAAKLGAKKGGGALVSGAAATAICSPGGPAAVICGVVAGVVTWVLVDKIGVEVDGYLNRDQMRKDITQAIEATVPEILETLKERQNSLIDASVSEIEADIERTFSPYRDGL